MKINKINYENFVIDYLEGGLSPDLKAEFDSFLQVNPEVYEEIKLYLSAPVLAEPNETVFAEKDLLKRRVISYRWLGSLAAAVAVLLIGSFFFFSTTVDPSNVVSIPDSPTKKLETTKPVKEKNIEVVHPDIQKEGLDKSSIAQLEVKKAQNETHVLDIAKPSTEKIKTKVSKRKLDTNMNESYFERNQSQLVSTETKPKQKKQQRPAIEDKKEMRTPAVFADIQTLDIETVSTVANTHIIYVPSASYTFIVAQEEEKTKNNKIIDLFMTKAYDDVDLKEAIVSNNLDRLNISKDKIKEMILPESILN